MRIVQRVFENRPLKKLLIACGVTFCVLVIVLILVDAFERRPHSHQSYYLDVSGGGRIRNDTWVVEGTWVDPVSLGSELHYENPDSDDDEVIDRSNHERRTLANVGNAAAIRSGSHVDFIFDDTLYQTHKGTWTEFRVAPADFLPLHYVDVPAAASQTRWAMRLVTPQCQIVNHSLEEHWFEANCWLVRSTRPTPLIYRRNDFGKPWQLDTETTFAKYPPLRTTSNWPAQVTVKLDVFRLHNPSGEQLAWPSPEFPEPPWPETGIPTIGERTVRYTESSPSFFLGTALTGQRINDTQAGAEIRPVWIDSLGNPVFLLQVFHEFGKTGKWMLRSQPWNETVLVARWAKPRLSAWVAVYLTLERI